MIGTFVGGGEGKSGEPPRPANEAIPGSNPGPAYLITIIRLPEWVLRRMLLNIVILSIYLSLPHVHTLDI